MVLARTGRVLMNTFLLYLLLLKATMTSFSGLASLPMIREDLVARRHALTDRQLNTSVAAARSGPGPVGIYVVSVGYQVGGVPGAIAGWLAMVTPAFCVIPLLRWFGRRATHPRVQAAIRAVILASCGLIVAAAVPLGRAALTGWFTVAIALASLAVLALTKIDNSWVMIGSAAVGAVAAALGLVR
jgi:chromate transporter